MNAKHLAVIGSGLAGLSTALWARKAGWQVSVITKGIGGLLLSNGCVDVLGYTGATGNESMVKDSPYEHWSNLNKNHPYHAIGVNNVKAGVEQFLADTSLYQNPLGTNVLTPTPIGVLRPTYAVPKTGIVLKDGMKLLVVGMKQFKDFPAQLIADNLSRCETLSLQARALSIDLPGRGVEADVNTTDYARAFDITELNPQAASEMRERFAHLINTAVKDGEIVLIPALMGLDAQTFSEFSGQIKAPVAEVPTVPPSIWGRRVYDCLLQQLRDQRVDIRLNATVTMGISSGKTLKFLRVQRAGGYDKIPVDAVVDASGGFASGNLRRDSYLRFSESIFNLPLFSHVEKAPENGGLHQIDLENRLEIERVLTTGVRVNSLMNPLDEDGSTVFNNLYCVGEILGECAPWREFSGEGLALGSAWAAVNALKHLETANLVEESEAGHE